MAQRQERAAGAPIQGRRAGARWLVAGGVLGAAAAGAVLVACEAAPACAEGEVLKDGQCVASAEATDDEQRAPLPPVEAGAAGGAGTSEASGGSSPVAPAGAAGAAGGPATVSLFSLWTVGVEGDALCALLGVHAAAHPGVTVENAYDPTNPPHWYVALSELLSRPDVPPDVLQLASVNDFVEGGQLAPLDDLAAAEGWAESFPRALLDAVSVDGHLYAVPVRVARLNSLYYDQRLFEKYGLVPPTTLDEFEALAERIKTSPQIQAEHAGGVAPIALGNVSAWPGDLVGLDMLLPAVGGAALYQRFFRGEADPNLDADADAALTEALRRALVLECGRGAVDRTAKPPRLLEGASCEGYLNADASTIDWTDALRLVASGAAAMAPMGSFARLELEDAGLVPGVTLGEVPFPGERAFVFQSDAFALAARAPAASAGRELLSTFASREGQRAFSAVMHGPPARADLDPASDPAFDPLDAALYRDLLATDALGTLVASRHAAWSLGMPLEDFGQKLQESLAARDMTTVYEYVRTAYAGSWR